ncbi:UDP-N-acetylmuramoyl-L-alanyl-D-glutamate--2,6-diaminopimelate ligase [Peribacillus sp. SCS-155]|uniref:UDP-N-acetylmuramoyl-L-alanyl-D-glutamate--2, 6-diaminopimelate ligase n=1 Tax=Peribacillus sedimenti TaxID=3115297 RepID=UPI00390590A9
MKLQELAELFTLKQTKGNLEVEITGIQMDSRKIEKGHLFICVPGIKGFLEDRHNYAKDAVKNGAAALLVERDLDIDIPTLKVKDARLAMAVIAAHFYNNPSKALKLIGITGTNGKTTTSYILERLLAGTGYATGLMGNNGVKVNGILYPTDINTQEPPILQKNLRKMVDEKVRYCVMEVSSQGLDMRRIEGCHFRTAIFTNLTQDHLDYHGTFEEYRHAKGLLFSKLGNAFEPSDKRYAVLNADDPASEYYRKVTSAEVITYGINQSSDVTAKNIHITSQGINFLLSSYKGEIELNLPLIGRFNVYNTLAAVASALLEGISLESIKHSLAALPNIRGRMEIVKEANDFLVLIDYAHSPDALENALGTIKEFIKGRLITVFGCGGDRDKSKRPIMGNIASRLSDFIIITSDNPRTEQPASIMKDIEKGVIEGFSQYELIESREDAIHKAIKMASQDDVVLIAGKGHETYQIYRDRTIHFDDKETAISAIHKRTNNMTSS